MKGQHEDLLKGPQGTTNSEWKKYTGTLQYTTCASAISSLLKFIKFNKKRKTAEEKNRNVTKIKVNTVDMYLKFNQLHTRIYLQLL